MKTSTLALPREALVASEINGLANFVRPDLHIVTRIEFRHLANRLQRKFDSDPGRLEIPDLFCALRARVDISLPL